MSDDFGFEFARPEFYFYLNQTGVYTVDGTNDAEDYNCLRVKILVIRIFKILLWYKTLLQINQYKTISLRQIHCLHSKPPNRVSPPGPVFYPPRKETRGWVQANFLEQRLKSSLRLTFHAK